MGSRRIAAPVREVAVVVRDADFDVGQTHGAKILNKDGISEHLDSRNLGQADFLDERTSQPRIAVRTVMRTCFHPAVRFAILLGSVLKVVDVSDLGAVFLLQAFGKVARVYDTIK